MQLTGDRFTTETASFGNDLSTLPNFPAEIRAPAGTLPGRQLLPAALRRPRHHDAGRRPGRAGGDEPGGAEGQPGRPAGGASADRRHRRVHPRATCQGRVRRATRSRTARSRASSSSACRSPSMTADALAEFGLGKKDAERAKNMFALGLLSWMYNRPTEGTIRFLSRSSASKPEIAAANIAAFRAGYNYGETTEAFAVSYEVKPAPMPPGHLPQHLRQPGPGLRAGRRRPALRPAAVPRRLPDHAGLGHPARAGQAQARSASARSRPRTRSPASAPRSAPPSAARSG